MIFCPSSDHATVVTGPACPRYVKTLFPVEASHTCTVASSPAEAICVRSNDHATASTGPEWPRYVKTLRPLDESHTCTVQSSLAEAKRLQLLDLEIRFSYFT